MVKFICMVGLPASGKSTYSQTLSERYNAMICSSDCIREELFNDVNNQTHNTDVFKELYKRIKNYLQNGQSVIMDSTNISYKRRMAFLQELKNIPCEKICVLMATPYEQCIKNNTSRDRVVPEYVIERMYRNFDIPGDYEGWDDIVVIYNSEIISYKNPHNFYIAYRNFNQHNTHHTLTLGEHCSEVCVALCNESEELRVAGLLHDCGKPFCKTFTNTKGDVTEQAHYYNHEHTGSYDSLFYYRDFHNENPLYIAILIRWHMQPYFWEKDNNERQHNKYRKLWGEELYKDIMLLHEADKNAH